MTACLVVEPYTIVYEQQVNSCAGSISLIIFKHVHGWPREDDYILQRQKCS